MNATTMIIFALEGRLRGDPWVLLLAGVLLLWVWWILWRKGKKPK